MISRFFLPENLAFVEKVSFKRCGLHPLSANDENPRFSDLFVKMPSLRYLDVPENALGIAGVASLLSSLSGMAQNDNTLNFSDFS